MPGQQLTPIDYTRIAAEATVSPVTVKRIYAGGRCRSTTHALVRETAKKLGLALPPEEPSHA